LTARSQLAVRQLSTISIIDTCVRVYFCIMCHFYTLHYLCRVNV